MSISTPHSRYGKHPEPAGILTVNLGQRTRQWSPYLKKTHVCIRQTPKKEGQTNSSLPKCLGKQIVKSSERVKPWVGGTTTRQR